MTRINSATPAVIEPDEPEAESMAYSGQGDFTPDPGSTGEKSAGNGRALMVVAAPTPNSSFDYSVLTDETAAVARAAAGRIRESVAFELLAIMEAGGELVKVKALLGHGHFGDWLRAEFALSERTAANYMQIYRAFGTKSETIADLPLAVVRELARPAVPEETRRSLVARAAGGTPPTVEHIRRLVTEQKQADKAARVEAARTPKQKENQRRQLARKRRREEEDALYFQQKRMERENALQRAVAMILEGFHGDIQGLAEQLTAAGYCELGRELRRT